MATIRKLRGKWQAMVRRKGIAPRSKSFDKKSDAEQWARDLEAQVDAAGYVPDGAPDGIEPDRCRRSPHVSPFAFRPCLRYMNPSLNRALRTRSSAG